MHKEGGPLERCWGKPAKIQNGYVRKRYSNQGKTALFRY